jgi:hypothetical protein
MIIIVTVLVGLATIATVLRVFARLKRRVKIEIDDYLCFTALFLLYGMLVQLIFCEMLDVPVQTQPAANIKTKGAPLAVTGLISQSSLLKLSLYSARSNNPPPLTYIPAPNPSPDLHREPIHLLRPLPRPQNLHHLLLPSHLLGPDLPPHLRPHKLAHRPLGLRHLPHLRASVPAPPRLLGQVRPRCVYRRHHLLHRQPDLQRRHGLCHPRPAPAHHLAS